MSDTPHEPRSAGEDARAANAPTRSGEISILLATRGRPQMLAEVFTSLQANTARKDKVAIWLYVDEDDSVTRQAIAERKLPDPGFPVHWHIGPQTGGLGETHQVLWNASKRASEIYMVSVDDARFDTKGWDDAVREVYAKYPDGILLAFPHDPMTADAATYPIFGGNWIKTLGYLFPGYFPYWFDDKWVNEIGCLIERFAKVPMLLYPIRGKGRTKRMRNLPFWTRFFQLTLDERKDAARKLIGVMYPTDEAKRAAAMAKVDDAAGKFVAEKEAFSDAYCVFQEERHTELTPEERLQFDPKYFKQEALMVTRIMLKARELMQAKRFAEAIEYLDCVQYSDVRVRQAHAMMAECLRELGRDGEAEKISAEQLSAWPQMNSLRRAFRFLGMVANDGKRMLVGLTEKGKKG